MIGYESDSSYSDEESIENDTDFMSRVGPNGHLIETKIFASFENHHFAEG